MSHFSSTNLVPAAAFLASALFLPAYAAAEDKAAAASSTAASPAPTASQTTQTGLSVLPTQQTQTGLSVLPAQQQQPPPSSTPVVSIGNMGLVVAAPDKSYSFKLSPFIQADGRYYADNGAPNRDTLLLRRVRIYFEGTYEKIFGFRIAPEFASADRADTNTQLADAWVTLNLSPAFGLRAGKFFGPVSIGSPDDRHFIETTYTNELSTNRDLGVEAAGRLFGKILSYRLGIFDGAPNNSWGETTNLSDGDFTFAGRLTLAPFSGSDSIFSDLTFAVGLSYGHEADGTRRIRTPGQQDLLRPRDGTSDLKYNGSHLRLAPAIEWYSGPFSLASEFILERWDDAVSGHVSNYAWRITTGWVLTGEKSTKSGVTPAASFSGDGKHWGAWELVARVGGVKVDSLYGHNVGAYSFGAGVNWYLTKNLQLRLNAEYTDFSGATVTRKNELCFITRLHLSF